MESIWVVWLEVLGEREIDRLFKTEAEAKAYAAGKSNRSCEERFVENTATQLREWAKPTNAKQKLDAQLAAATGGTPKNKVMLDAQLAAATTRKGECPYCEGLGCEHCSHTGEGESCNSCHGLGCSQCEQKGQHTDDYASDGTCLWCHGMGGGKTACPNCGN